MSDTREIMVKMRGNKNRLVSNIPADAKITFGPVSPGRGSGENALRIYTSKENQLAVFVGVEEFRDLSLAVKEEKVTQTRREDHQVDSSGISGTIEYDELRQWEEI